MGFGIHPNSGIAQELSESIDSIFRKRMDAFADAALEASTSPEVHAWLVERRALEAKHGGHQRRLYAAHTYCDDNIVIIVGIYNALAAINIRAEIEREAGLIMAIPEKRMLGTWGIWLGIYIFAGLGASLSYLDLSCCALPMRQGERSPRHSPSTSTSR